MKPRSFISVSARARFCTVTSGTSSSAPEADFASTPVASGLWRAVVTMAFTANAAAERRMAPTLCGSVIWSSTSTMPSCGSVVDVGRGQGIGLRQQALVHGVGAEPLVDQSRPHDFRRHAGVDVVVRQPPGGVLGQQQLADLPLRDWPAPPPPCASHRESPARRGLASRSRRGRPAGRGFPALFEGLCRRRGGTVAFGRDRSWQACVTGSGLWQFGPFQAAGRFDGSPWLTLPGRFPINAPDREPVIGRRGFSVIHGLSRRHFGGRVRDAVERGSVPSGKGS